MNFRFKACDIWGPPDQGDRRSLRVRAREKPWFKPLHFNGILLRRCIRAIQPILVHIHRNFSLCELVDENRVIDAHDLAGYGRGSRMT